eukprot:Selendium_serpulae@DN6337_c2_g3_i4.p1
MPVASATPIADTCGWRWMKSVPKVELHAHLFGCIRRSTLAELRQTKQEINSAQEISGGETSPDNGVQLNAASSLEDCFQYFDHVYNTIRDGAHVRRIMNEVLSDFAEDNVKYLELRTGIKSFKDMTREEYVESLVEASNEVYLRTGMNVRLILSLNRSRLTSRIAGELDVREIKRMADLYPEAIVGVDISGHPLKGDLDFVIPSLKEILSDTLKLTVHCAELDCPEVEKDTKKILDVMQPSRLGHCCFLSDSQFQGVMDKNVTVELCPSSNQVTMGLTHFKDHHFQQYWESGHEHLAICSDDTGLFTTTLSEELMHIATAFE